MTTKMMSLREIELASAALGNQLKAGLPISDATRRMGRLQKKYAPFWADVTNGLSNGHYLSEYVDRVWPEAVVNAVKAGEDTGNLERIFERIETTMQIQREINNMLLELIYPLVLILGGFSAFIFFMAKVIPAMSKAFGAGDGGFIFDLSSKIEKIFNEDGIIVLVSTVVICFMIFSWLQDADNRAKIIENLVKVPILGDALRNLYFGIWAHYMALISSTGSVSLEEGLKLTSFTLPKPLRAGLLLMANEVTDKGVLIAGDSDRQAADDPRQLWPFYVSNSFIISYETGLLSEELLRSAPSMIEEGKTTLKYSLKIANAIALLIAGLLISMPMTAYYMQMAKALQNALHG